MIEINLLPGSVKKASRAGTPRLQGGNPFARFKMPGSMDKTMLRVVGAWVLGIAIVAYLHLTTSGKVTQMAEDLELARQDSARLLVARQRLDTLRAREAEISRKLEVIQEIDAGRFVYAHIMDEVSRALPPYIWLVQVSEVSAENVGRPLVRIEGRAGNYFALGRYIEELENSPFVQQVRLISSARTTVDERTVYGFAIEVGYQDPPADAIQTVPLFAGQATGEGN
jgi:Tfp pilus assembly protein PilN